MTTDATANPAPEERAQADKAEQANIYPAWEDMSSLQETDPAMLARTVENLFLTIEDSTAVLSKIFGKDGFQWSRHQDAEHAIRVRLGEPQWYPVFALWCIWFSAMQESKALRAAPKASGRNVVFDEITRERGRQIANGWTPEHDEQDHDELDWLAILNMQLGKAADRALGVSTYGTIVSPYGVRNAQREWRKRLIKIAAVCVAAAEAHDRIMARAPETPR